MKRTGPGTEPWGTPQVRSEGEDFTSFTVGMEKEPGPEAVSSVKGSKQWEWRKSQGLKQSVVLKAASSQ